MPTKPLPWLKLDHGYLEDAQLGNLPVLSQLLYFKLYMLAHQCQADGLITLTMDEICWKLHISKPELEPAINDLVNIGLFKMNGRGPELTRYLADGNISNSDRKDTRERVNKHRENMKRKSNTPSNADVTPRESESESEVESEVEKESSQSTRSKQQTQADRLTVNISKSELFKFIKINDKFKPQILKDQKITPADILAEYSRNLARPNIDKPESITAMNLIRHEYPPDKEYKINSWIDNLPDEIIEHFDLENLDRQAYVLGEYKDKINH